MSDTLGTPTWNKRITFIFAAAGSAVGLGNIWKFPYIVGENGGGAFILVYLLCLLIAGIPIMIAEVLLGKRGRLSPPQAVEHLAVESGQSTRWSFIGLLGLCTGFIILSYYSVIAGWALAYIPKAFDGQFHLISGEQSQAISNTFLASPVQMLIWYSLFISITAAVVIGGVTRGLGRAVDVLMPLLFLLLIVVLVFAAIEGDFNRALGYLFSVDFGAVKAASVLQALGHAFFTLSIGMGAIMVYGSYMPDDAPIGQTVLIVAAMDTLVALVAGMAIFPLVFANPAIEPAAGPGLLFESLPIAFGAIAGGSIIGALFFLLIGVAALTSAISLIEPAVAWLEGTGRATRLKAGMGIALACWVIGIGSVLSFNLWADLKLFGKFTWFGFSDFLTSDILLPLGGIFMALFVGHKLKTRIREESLEFKGLVYRIWLFLVRWVSPLAVSAVLVWGLLGRFGVLG